MKHHSASLDMSLDIFEVSSFNGNQSVKMQAPPQKRVAILCIILMLLVIYIHIISNDLLPDLHFLTRNETLQEIPNHFENVSSEINMAKANPQYPNTKNNMSLLSQETIQLARTTIEQVTIANTTKSTSNSTVLLSRDSRVNAIYTCGYDQVTEHDDLLSNRSKQHYFLDDVFPDFIPKGRWKSTSNPNPDDILVYGMEGPCDVTNEQTMFPGKILYHNGEPNYHVIKGDFSYQIGPAADDGNHTMRVLYISLVLFMFFPEQQRQIILQQRPTSTKEHSLIYVASKCHNF